MAEEKSNNYISLQEATEYCSYTQEYLSLRARQGKLKAVKIGRNWLTKKEWIKEYVERVEEYNNNLHTEKFVALPKNLPVKPLSRRWSFFQIRQPRFALIVGLVFVLLTAGIVSGKENFKSVFDDLDPYVYPVRDFVVTAAKGISKDISNRVKEISQAGDRLVLDSVESFKNVYENLLPASKELAQVASPDVLKSTLDTFKEYGQWVNESVKNQISKIKTAYLITNDFVEEKLTTFGHRMSNMVSKFAQGIRKIPQAVTGLFKKEVAVEKPKEEKPEEFAKKGELENLQKELKELKEKPEKEITKEVEVSRVIRIEPIKEITKEIITLDDESLKIIQATLLKQETNVEKLRLTASRGYINLPPVVGPSGAVSLTTLGTITEGTWQAGTIGDAYVVDDLTITSTKAGSFSYSPTLAHTGTWAIGSLTWNQSDAAIYINPATATADSNLIGVAVADSVVFSLDAEGDIFARNLVLTGSTTSGTTTIAGDLSVEGNTIIGDSTTDTLTLNPAILTWAGGNKTIDI
ncbi:hypothetical protein COY23_03630, partial [bacterium (Candidatus Torokbacteria) CG_4_10_14_0_2_um_filter_35_8]